MLSADLDPLPSSVDLSDNFPIPGDQGAQSSAVGWAVAYARAYYAKKSEGRDLASSKNLPSPFYIYNSITQQPGRCDSGANLSAALNLLKVGVLSLADFPRTNSCEPPSAEQRMRADDFRIVDFAFIDPKDGAFDDIVKGALAMTNPVIIGIRINTKAFGLLRPGSTYRVPPNLANLDGSHAMTVVGYDDARQAFKLINSWGTSWADKGFGWVDYDTFKRGVFEAYTFVPVNRDETQTKKQGDP